MLGTNKGLNPFYRTAHQEVVGLHPVYMLQVHWNYIQAGPTRVGVKMGAAVAEGRDWMICSAVVHRIYLWWAASNWLFFWPPIVRQHGICWLHVGLPACSQPTDQPVCSPPIAKRGIIHVKSASSLPGSLPLPGCAHSMSAHTPAYAPAMSAHVPGSVHATLLMLWGLLTPCYIPCLLVLYCGSMMVPQIKQKLAGKQWKTQRLKSWEDTINNLTQSK